MKLRERLASNLKRIRSGKDLSQAELAQRAGVDRTYVGNLERGDYSASLDVIEQLAEALGVDAIDLLFDPQRRSKPVGKAKRPANPNNRQKQ